MSVPKKLIFLSLIRIDNLNERGIYHDLLREFVKYGYDVTIICPVERRTKLKTRLIKNSSLTILQVKTLNIQKCNILEKGLSTLSLNFLFKSAIKKLINDVDFDLILYSTPPITLVKLITWLKSKNEAKTYLLLKDIFPQNALDLGYIKKGGILHMYFSKTEKRLYEISDKIGCMSPANVDYLTKAFPEFKSKIEINPNSIDLTQIPIFRKTKSEIRLRWGIPIDSTVFLYGGNIGKPQGVNFLLNVIDECKTKLPRAYFLLVGDGTDFENAKQWFECNKPNNAQIIKKLPKIDFDFITSSCDVGIILLRKEFTIPNFPSRLLTYMENKLAILAMTDLVSDVGRIAESNDFGKWLEYGDIQKAILDIESFCEANNNCKKMGDKAFDFLKQNFNVKISFEKINKTLIDC